MIWTTTPWTLPANLAICLHPDYEYTLARAGSDRYLIAGELLADFAKETGIELSAGETFRGTELEGVVCRHPFMDWNSPLILGEHVTLEAGTGCVHTAPGHGLEDFEVGIKYNLRISPGYGDRGVYRRGPQICRDETGSGQPGDTEDMTAAGSLLKAGKIVHQYPHCWRCKNPVSSGPRPNGLLPLKVSGRGFAGYWRGTVDPGLG